MSKVIAVHSSRRGTGKTSLAANLSVLLAAKGNRVGLVDTDIQFPGIHVRFGLEEDDLNYSLNDFLRGKCEISDAAYDVTDRLGKPESGKLFLIPASSKSAEIARVLQEGYDVNLLNDGCQDLIEDFELDFLMIDTQPGINEETLLSIAISDVLLVVMRPDQQDFQGTSVTVEVARKLYVSNLMLLINKVPTIFDFDDIKLNAEQLYNADVVGVLPHSDEMMALASEGIFAVKYPNHVITKSLDAIAELILDI